LSEKSLVEVKTMKIGPNFLKKILGFLLSKIRVQLEPIPGFPMGSIAGLKFKVKCPTGSDDRPTPALGPIEESFYTASAHRFPIA
jgi:hypothetical protein